MAGRRRWFLIALLPIATIVGFGAYHLWPRDNTHSDSKEPQAQVLNVTPASPPEMPSPILGSGVRLEGQVIDADEKPVGGAHVELWDRPTRSTTTEADGSFVFETVDRGTHRLIANKDDLASDPVVAVVGDRAENVTIHLHAGTGIKFHVVEAVGGAPIPDAEIEAYAGQRAKTLADGTATMLGLGPDFVSISVHAPGHGAVEESFAIAPRQGQPLEHTVTMARGASVSGTVVDPDGKLVANATVYIETVATEAWHRDSKPFHTDAKGSWTCPALPAGKYTLAATSKLFTKSSPLPIEIDGIHELSGVVVHLDLGAQLVGKVVASGRPIAGATIHLSNDSQWSAKTSSDVHGAFGIYGTPAGEFHVWATEGQRSSKRALVTLEAHRRTEIALELEDSSIAGVVVDLKGEPSAEVTVYAHPVSTPMDSGHVAVTDGHGHFDFGGLPAGEYGLVARRNDVTMSENGTEVIAKTGDHNVKLVAPTVTTIKGRVVIGNQPVTSYGLVISEPNEMAWRQSFPHPVNAADGRFVQSGVAAGRRAVVIVGVGIARKIVEVDIPEGKTYDVGDIVVDHGQRVTGHVTDAAGPVEGATVTVEQEAPVMIGDASPLVRSLGGGASAVTDANGSFTLEGISAPTHIPGDRGNRINQISANHPRRGIAPPVALPTTVNTIELVLGETGALDGKITGPTTDHTRVQAQSGRQLSSAKIGQDRTFHFERLAAGEYDLVLATQNFEGYVLPPTHVVVAGGKRTSVTVTVPDVVTIAAHVTDGTCELVMLFGDPPDMSKSLGHSFCTGSDVQMRNVPPGSYRLCIDATHCAAVIVAPNSGQQSVEIRSKSP